MPQHRAAAAIVDAQQSQVPRRCIRAGNDPFDFPNTGTKRVTHRQHPGVRYLRDNPHVWSRYGRVNRCLREAGGKQRNNAKSWQSCDGHTHISILHLQQREAQGTTGQIDRLSPGLTPLRIPRQQGFGSFQLRTAEAPVVPTGYSDGNGTFPFAVRSPTPYGRRPRTSGAAPFGVSVGMQVRL